MLSHINYGLIFGCSAKNGSFRLLQRLQNKALRVCYLAPRYSSNYSLHRDAGILPIDLRLKQDLLLQMHHKIYLRKAGVDIKKVNTRQNVGIIPICEHPTSNKFLKSVTYYGPRLWVNLPAEVRNLSDF